MVVSLSFLGGTTAAIQRCPLGFASAPVADLLQEWVASDGFARGDARAAVRLFARFAFLHDAVPAELRRALVESVHTDPSYETCICRIPWHKCLGERPSW